ncbi:MAG: hypothetical protein RBR16_04390 [Syntrophus sp. (in: bacteria)]|nr:hypothetical protein [Syntrophus sp. (in: bacteria)]
MKEEEELRTILDHLAAQDKALIEIHRQLAEIRNDRERLNAEPMARYNATAPSAFQDKGGFQHAEYRSDHSTRD